MAGETVAPPETGTAEEQALEALEHDFGAAYMLGYDDERGWWAARRDQIGGYLAEDTPEELRAAIEEDHDMKPVVHLWCRACGKRATMRGGVAVHALTGYRAGLADGHLAEAVGQEPPLWKAAREIEAEYGGTFTVGAPLGILRADWSTAVVGHFATAVHYTAPTGELLRRQLDEAVKGTRWERAAEEVAT
jgi:hypothetical protein